MKTAYLTLVLAVLVSGCATKYPKEDLKEVFRLVQEKKFEEAQSKLRGNYETYSGDVISSVKEPGSIKDTAEGLIESAKGTIRYCEKASKDAIDLKTNENGDQSEMNTAKEEFDQYCVEPLDQYSSEVSKIKKYADVDLKPMLLSYGSVFNKVFRRMSSDFNQIEHDQTATIAANAAAKDRYEQTEDYYSKKLCETDDRIKMAQKIIKREQDAASISGFQNNHKLYEAGKVVQFAQERIEHFSSEFKTKFGKSWTVSDCHN